MGDASVIPHLATDDSRSVRWLERALGLSPGDLNRGALLFLYLFLIITSYVVGKVARDALFLARFKAVQLPYADIATALLVGFVVAVYVRIGRHRSVRNLLIGSSLFFSSNCLLVWALARLYHFGWLYPLFYVWVGIFGVLAPAQVWTLANYVLTTREARRLFGVVGSGAIVGWIFAGFFCKHFVRAFGTEALLLAVAIFLAVCAVLVHLIWRQNGRRLENGSGQHAGDEPRNLRESMSLVWSSKYLRSIAAVICLSSLVTTIVGWQFKALAKEFIVNKDGLAIFFGDFNFYAGILSLAVQLLLTTRVLRQFGIGPALFTVPVALLAGSLGVLVSGSLFAAVLLKGSDQVLRYSIDKSTVELLYLPLSSRVKLQVKWFIDTVIWRMGDGLAGITVLVLATYLHLATRYVSWAVMVMIAGWGVAVYLARRHYVGTLTTSIRQHRMELERASAAALDRDTTQVLAAKFGADDANEVLYALSVFEVERRRAPHPAIRGLLEHASPQVRRKALTILAAANDTAMLGKAEEMLKDPDLDVRTEALLFLCRYKPVDPLVQIEELGDFADFSIRAAVVAFAAHPGETQNLLMARKILEAMAADESSRMRVEAARLLGRVPDRFDPLLAHLLGDADKDVVREAIRSVGMLRKRRLVPELVDRLASPDLCADAAEALAAFGDSIIGTLRDHVADNAVPLPIRREIAGILAAIGSEEALRVLEPELMEGDTVLRRRVLNALNKLTRQHPEVDLDRQMLETVLAAEVLGHYRSYQIFHTLNSEAGLDVTLALTESMNGERERIFRLLSLLYPTCDFESAYYGLQSSNQAVHDNALEFLENVLKPELRQLLLPLLDAQVTVAARAQRASHLVHVRMETREEAAAALIGSEDSWLRSCGAYAIGKLRLRSLEAQLNRCIEDPDPLLRQAAREAKTQLKINS